MKCFDFIIIGGGVSGLITAYFLKEYNTLVVDKDGIFSQASGAAGAFLFPKISLSSFYTDFINNAIFQAINFYHSIGVKVYKKGVLILPRDEKDLEKFKNYEKYIKVPFKKLGDGFFFPDGAFIEPEDVKKRVSIKFEQVEISSIEKKECFILNNYFKTKNIIFATGYETNLLPDYLKYAIRGIWGERIEIVGDYSIDDIFYHKKVSVAKINNKLRIGATHKRGNNFSLNSEEAQELIAKAKEIIEIKKFTIDNIKGSYRSGSIDYFPIVSKIINDKKTILEDKYILKGDKPKKVFYFDNMYIINGMGGRGFSNAVVSAQILKEKILNNQKHYLDSYRLFIKWARKKATI